MPAYEFQYVILPARPGRDFPQMDLHNKAYSYWKTFWQRTFVRKAPNFWNPLDFFRQDFLFCLFYKDEIAAQNLSMLARSDQQVTFDLPYFAAYGADGQAMLKEERAKSLMTIEYTSVNQLYGERKTGVRLAEVMNGLALETFLAKGFDATFAMPRRLSGLAEVTANYGYRKIAENYAKAGWVLDLYLGFRDEITQHPDPKYAELIRRLWEHRIDYSAPGHVAQSSQQSLSIPSGVSDDRTDP